MKPPSSDAESARGQQPAPVRAPNRFLVAADELGHFECGQQPIGQFANRWRRRDRQVADWASMLLIRVRVLPHGVLRDDVASHGRCDVKVDVKRDEPVRMPPRVNGPGVDHASAAGSEDPTHAGCVLAHGIRLERECNQSGTLIVPSAHQEAINARELYPRADLLHDAAARSRMPRTSLAAASLLGTGPSVVRIDAADDVVEPPSSASRVACRCLE